MDQQIKYGGARLGNKAKSKWINGSNTPAPGRQQGEIVIDQRIEYEAVQQSISEIGRWERGWR
jgi:hypothetical protein